MIEPFKKKSLDRLKRIRGQLDGIIKMVEDEKYCIDIMTQVRAVQGGLRGVATLVLESHLETCGEHKFSTKDPVIRKKFIQELIKVCDLSSR